MYIFGMVENIGDEDVLWNNNFRGIVEFDGYLAVANVEKAKYPRKFKKEVDHIDYFDCPDKTTLLEIFNTVLFGNEKHLYFTY